MIQAMHPEDDSLIPDAAQNLSSAPAEENGSAACCHILCDKIHAILCNRQKLLPYRQLP